MPNHVANIITINGDKEQVEKLVNFVKSEKSDFDFDNIIPMPKELDIESSSEGDMGLRYFYVKSKRGSMLNDNELKFIGKMNEIKIDNRERFDRIVELGLKYAENITKYGYRTWYDFKCSAWGTKWNAYDVETDVNADGVRRFKFNTAWTFPNNIIKTLSEKFPELTIEFVYADEDTSFNIGKGRFIGGEEIDGFYPEGGSKEAFDLYFETHPEDREDYEFDENDGTYYYRRDDD